MARRYIGDAVVTVLYSDELTGKSFDGRWWYTAIVSVRDGGVTSGRFTVGSGVGGFGVGMGADSSEAYDRIAASAACFASSPDEDATEKQREIAASINDAIACASDANGVGYMVQRIRNPKAPYYGPF